MVREDDSPKELNKIKDHKLTRRRVMETAKAIGFSTPVALAMTAEDVKASDSDQVTVSFDVSGDTKYTVSADRMDWLQRARRANKNIQKRFMNKDGVIAIGMSGGGGKDNPHVVVTLDRNNEKSDERRGELPEKENGVRVEIKEGSKDGRVNACNPDCWPESQEFPGGQQITGQGPQHGICTSSSEMFNDDLDWFGWTTAAHCFNSCDSDGVTVSHFTDDCVEGYVIGEGGTFDTMRDIAFIEAKFHDQSYLNIKPSDHSEGVEILDTLTREGFGIIDEEYGDTPAIFQYGVGSCYQNYSLKRWDENLTNPDYECNDMLYDQMVVEHPEIGGTSNEGDSGSLHFVEDPNNGGNYYAMGSHTGYFGTFDIEHHGPQGFTIYNVYGRAWRS